MGVSTGIAHAPTEDDQPRPITAGGFVDGAPIVFADISKQAGLDLQQQARFDDFIEIFNQERPHEALDMKCPAEVYRPSPRLYQGLPDFDPIGYPSHRPVGNRLNWR